MKHKCKGIKTKTNKNMKEYNLSEVVEHVAIECDVPKAIVHKNLKAAFAAFAANLPLAEKQRIEIAGLGVFKLVKHREKVWKLAGKTGVTPAHFTVEFAPHPAFIQLANDNLKDPNGLVITK